MINPEEPLRTSSVLEILDVQSATGLQVVLALGCLRSTKALYKSGGKYYLFDMNEDWYITRTGGFTKAEILNTFADAWWFVELPIS